MGSPSKRFVFETARPEDGPEILEILEDVEFSGQISLVYTRRPDPYVSFHMEGEDANIILCRDLVAEKIVSLGACTVVELFVNGKVTRAAYLFGLRVRKEYRAKYPVIHLGYEHIRALYKDKGIQYYFTSILEENTYAQKVLEKERNLMPRYLPLSKYETFVFKTGLQSSGNTGYVLKRACEEDIPVLAGFLNIHGKKQQFFPAVNESFLRDNKFPGLSIDDFFILYDCRNEIAACGAAWDQRVYKQYLLKGYGGVLKALYPVSSVFKLFGYPKLPEPGEMLEFFTLSFWAVRDNDYNIFKTFIKQISSQMIDYPFFILGVCQDNPLKHACDRIPHISYRSRLYLVDWEKSENIKEQIDWKLPVYMECGML